MKKNRETVFNARYLSLLTINLVMSISFSMVYTTMATYVTGLGVAVAVAGMVTGAFNIASMVLRPVSGVISDRVNRKWLLVGSTAAMGIAILGYAIFTSTPALIALRILHGIAFALSTTVNMAIIPGIVPENRIGEAICYFGLSQSLATAVGPALGLALANAGGFRLDFGVSAMLCLLGAAIGVPLRITDDEGRPKAERRSLRLSDVVIPRCLPFTMMEITIASVAGVESSMLAMYAATQGIANIGWYFTISAVTVCVCRLFMGRIIDRKGTFAVYPGIALMIVGLLVLWLQSAPWMFGVAAVIKTIGVSLAKPALQAASVKSVMPEKRGAAVSTYYIGTDLGQGVAPMIAGRIVDVNGGNYGSLFAIFAVPLAVASALYAFFSHRIKSRPSA